MAKKGYSVLGMISRTFCNKKKTIMKPLNKSLVRPHLDYCIQAWRPHLIKDINVLERVQRRATRMVEECKGLDYYSWLKALGLTTLETRRIRADLIEVFKIVTGEEGLKEETFFIRENKTIGRERRGHKYKLFKKRIKTDA